MDNGCEERNNLNFFFNIYEKWLSKTEKMGCYNYVRINRNFNISLCECS